MKPNQKPNPNTHPPTHLPLKFQFQLNRTRSMVMPTQTRTQTRRVLPVIPTCTLNSHGTEAAHEAQVVDVAQHTKT